MGASGGFIASPTLIGGMPEGIGGVGGLGFLHNLSGGEVLEFFNGKLCLFQLTSIDELVHLVLPILNLGEIPLWILTTHIYYII